MDGQALAGIEQLDEQPRVGAGPAACRGPRNATGRRRPRPQQAPVGQAAQAAVVARRRPSASSRPSPRARAPGRPVRAALHRGAAEVEARRCRWGGRRMGLTAARAYRRRLRARAEPQRRVTAAPAGWRAQRRRSRELTTGCARRHCVHTRSHAGAHRLSPDGQPGGDRRAAPARAGVRDARRPTTCAQVAEVAVPRRFAAGQVIFREGDESDTCYVVRTGHARAVREHADGRTITLAHFGPGDIFGELAMFDDERRSATVETLDDVEAIAILGADMRRLLREHPDIAVKLVIALGRRLREANERLARQSFQTVQSRVAGGARRSSSSRRSAEGAGDARRARARSRRPTSRSSPAPRASRPAASSRCSSAPASSRRAAAASPSTTRPRSSATSTERRHAPIEREFSAGGVVVRDGDECVVIVPTRRAADGAKVLALPKGHPDAGETAGAGRAARGARGGGVEAELVEQARRRPLLVPARRPADRQGRRRSSSSTTSPATLERPRPRGRGARAGCRSTRPRASSPTRASARWSARRCRARDR